MGQCLQISVGKKMALKTITRSQLIIQLNRHQADLRQSGNRTTQWGNSVNHVDEQNKELRNGEATVKRMQIWKVQGQFDLADHTLPSTFKVSSSLSLPSTGSIDFRKSLHIVASRSSRLTFCQLSKLCGKRMLFLQSISEKLQAWSSFAFVGWTNEWVHPSLDQLSSPYK